MQKSVKYILPSVDINMGGIIVKQALPTQKISQVDPYLLLHHGVFKFRDTALAHHQGIGPHPHRGFSPVTFVIRGEVYHRDSRGNEQIAKQGDIQWLHAGAGIVHSERPTESLVMQNGVQEVIQLWINSPSSNKMQIPKYQYLEESQVPFYLSDDRLVRTKVVAGSSKGMIGKIATESELMVLWSYASIGGRELLEIPQNHNAMLYLINGSLRISGYGRIDEKSLVVFEEHGNEVEIETLDNAEFLLLTGVPINEKVVQQGPYVMNSQTQILEAIRDYQMGKMGILIE